MVKGVVGYRWKKSWIQAFFNHIFLVKVWKIQIKKKKKGKKAGHLPRHKNPGGPAFQEAGMALSASGVQIGSHRASAVQGSIAVRKKVR